MQSPQEVMHRGKVFPFKLSNTLFSGADHMEEGLTHRVDVGLLEFWKISEGADLFVDAEYGQWGLRLFNQSEVSHQPYYEDISPHLLCSDRVIGEFRGDTDLLIMDTASMCDGECSIVVAGGLEARREWKVIASSFSQFLDRYIRSSGDKYWEANVH